MILVMPALMAEQGGRTPFVAAIFQVLSVLIYVFGITASRPSRAVFSGALVVAGVATALFWFDHFAPNAGWGTWKAGVRAGATVSLTALVTRHVLREGPITFHRIRGAVAVYLLLGLTWANLYEMIEHLAPGAFRFPEAHSGPEDLSATLAYYSFVTLTTIGYGEILPVHPVARSAAILEGLLGQLFPAILIARLVAMELAAHMNPPPR
jgi:hypothetical protein